MVVKLNPGLIPFSFVSLCRIKNAVERGAGCFHPIPQLVLQDLATVLPSWVVKEDPWEGGVCCCQGLALPWLLYADGIQLFNSRVMATFDMKGDSRAPSSPTNSVLECLWGT